MAVEGTSDWPGFRTLVDIEFILGSQISWIPHCLSGLIVRLWAGDFTSPYLGIYQLSGNYNVVVRI